MVQSNSHRQEPEASSHLPTQVRLTLLLEAHPVRGLGCPHTLEGLQGAARRSRIRRPGLPPRPFPPSFLPVPHLPWGSMGPDKGRAGSPSSARTVMHTDWERDSRW